MSNTKLVLVLLGLLLEIPGWAQTPLGVWKAFDADHDKPRSLIKIYQENDRLFGKVVKLFRTAEENKNPLCFNCKEEDSRYNQPVLGMVLMKDLKRKNKKRWEGGEVLDPDKGNTYRCYLEVLSPDKIKVRGYLGFSLFGRTKYLYRVDEYEEGTVEIIGGD